MELFGNSSPPRCSELPVLFANFWVVKLDEEICKGEKGGYTREKKTRAAGSGRGRSYRMPFCLNSFLDGAVVGNLAENTQCIKLPLLIFRPSCNSHRDFSPGALAVRLHKETKDSAPCFTLILGTCGSSLKFKQTLLVMPRTGTFCCTADIYF